MREKRAIGWLQLKKANHSRMIRTGEEVRDFGRLELEEDRSALWIELKKSDVWTVEAKQEEPLSG